MNNDGNNFSADSMLDVKMVPGKLDVKHIRLHPEHYIGSMEHVSKTMWVYDEHQNRITQRQINYVPGLYKIFDEILVNAADNKQRDKMMNMIQIEIDDWRNVISIWNNGQGIPVTINQQHNMYIPELIFGQLMTSSHYNNGEKEVSGSCNGCGAKLCNIFSSCFTVETATTQYGKSFKQTWFNNMSEVTPPEIVEFSGTDFTCITFSPDLKAFKMESLDVDIVSLMSRRAYDIAATTKGVNVYLNGKRLAVRSFRDYIDLYLKPNEKSGQPVRVAYQLCNEHWEVACCQSYSNFQQVSFVNSIATVKGGQHVEHVVENIIKYLVEVVKFRSRAGFEIKPSLVRNHMWVFVKCLIENPTFDSQTKENMTLPERSFGSKCTLSGRFFRGVSKVGIIESVLSWVKIKMQNCLHENEDSKSVKIKNVPKLEDANEAGGEDSHLCTLFLTEGDSAKAFAIAGLGVIGRDLYGVLPLRGKLLNVRETTFERKEYNSEINNLVRVIGLQYQKRYTTIDDLKSLRYGKLMILVDQDQNGAHIKGLLINFIHTNWPELVRLPFLQEFITPIVKAIKDDNVLTFYSLPEFEEWKIGTPNHQSYEIKYYKGLGAFTSEEVKEYFEDFERHRIAFKYDGSVDDDAIVMAFSKMQVDTRKEWLSWHMDEVKRRKALGLSEHCLYTNITNEVSYSDFVNHELVLSSNADNIRTIPCLLDGFNPAQRKVMFTCLKRYDTREVKVAQLSGAVAEFAAYHDGEMSLQSTIASMAHNFIGSNNINLLEPRGQFGTRLHGGKDIASVSDIYTIISPLARLIFHPDDDLLLLHEMDDGKRIEPQFYVPIIPMVLVNGADGKGTGWSTKICNHNPRQILHNIRRMLLKEQPLPMRPWYKNFKGNIHHMSHGRYVSSGNIQILQNNIIEISELPVGTWTLTYIESVLQALSNAENCKPVIKEYRSYHTEKTVRFVVTLAPGDVKRIQAKYGSLHRFFKLTSYLSTNQMHCFDHNKCLRRFPTSLDILKEYFPIRLQFYQKRKDFLVGKLTAQVERLTDKARFIFETCERTLVIENKTMEAIIVDLIKRGYRPDPVKEWRRRMQIKDDEVGEEEDEREEDEEEEEEEEEEYFEFAAMNEDKKPIDREATCENEVKQFDYLLGMSIWMLGEESRNELLKKRAKKLAELEALKAKTIETLWLDDLYEFEKKLNEVEQKERLDELDIINKRSEQITAEAKCSMEDTFPDPNGIKVTFKAKEVIMKKIIKAAAMSVKTKIIKRKPVKVKGTRIIKGKGKVDKFTAMVEACVV